MRRSRLHPLIALLCALLLLGAQQAAYAHFIGHIGNQAETVAQEGGDADHGAASSLSHVCTTCASFAALDAAPPVVAAAVPSAAATAAALPSLPAAVTPADPAPPYAARAPPAVL
ncbi:MAG: hypothetical protein OEL88_01180 [Sterolibacteriaceae bacterium MAG5]|nr:hypothetical protein [Candidatus Nitricoxidireducens bremensis]